MKYTNLNSDTKNDVLVKIYIRSCSELTVWCGVITGEGLDLILTVEDTLFCTASQPHCRIARPTLDVQAITIN